MKRNQLLYFLLLSLFFGSSLYAQNVPSDLPKDATPGKCYAKCLIPDEWTTVEEKILVRAASSRVEVLPAEYETVTEKVLKKAEATRLVYVPAEYEEVTERIMIKPEIKRTITIPAEYETVTEKVLVKEGTKKIIPIPAEFTNEEEKIMVMEASSRIEKVPAIYEKESQKIEVTPASTKWVKRKADQNCLSANPEDCLVWCLVEVPATYRTVVRQVRKGCPEGYTDNGDDCTKEIAIPGTYDTRKKRMVKKPASTREEIIPAEYKTIKKTVLKKPEEIKEEVIPAEYKTVTRRVIKKEATYETEVIPAEYETLTKKVIKQKAGTRSIDIPAEYATVTKRQLVRKGGFSEWREILCADKVTSYTVRQIQRALIEKGYNVGPAGVDNIMGADTKAALRKFQKDEGLPIGGLNIETLKALGIKF